MQKRVKLLFLIYYISLVLDMPQSQKGDTKHTSLDPPPVCWDLYVQELNQLRDTLFFSYDCWQAVWQPWEEL